MNATLAAYVFALLIAVVIVFQILLVTGVPWGELAWGGGYPGQLPVHMRVASAASVVLLAVIALIVLMRAGVVLRRWQPLSRKVVWAVVVYCLVGVVANAMTPSHWERVIWLPVTIALLVCSIVVARARDHMTIR